MTLEEYLHDRKRLFGVVDKGFKVEIHREGVSEESIAKRIEQSQPSLPRRRVIEQDKAPTIAIPQAQGPVAGLLELPGVKRTMALLSKPQQRFWTLLLQNDGSWFKKSKLPLLLGYSSVGSIDANLGIYSLVKRGIVEQTRIDAETAYRTNLRATIA
jgi:hypothetical protein